MASMRGFWIDSIFDQVKAANGADCRWRANPVDFRTLRSFLDPFAHITAVFYPPSRGSGLTLLGRPVDIDDTAAGVVLVRNC